MIQRPVAVGLKVCQQAIVEEKTKHVTLVNCIRRPRVKSFPAEYPQLYVFVSLADGIGTCKLSINVTWLKTLDEIATRSWQASFSGPLDEHWFLARLPRFSFPQPSRYEVALFADGEFIAQSIIEVMLKGKEK